MWKGQCTQPGVTGPDGGLCLVHSLTLIIFLPQLWSSLGLVSRFYLLVPPPPKLYSKWGNICSSWREGFQEDTSAKAVVTKGRRERLRCFSGRKGNFSSSFRAELMVCCCWNQLLASVLELPRILATRWIHTSGKSLPLGGVGDLRGFANQLMGNSAEPSTGPTWKPAHI